MEMVQEQDASDDNSKLRVQHIVFDNSTYNMPVQNLSEVDTSAEQTSFEDSANAEISKQNKKKHAGKKTSPGRKWKKKMKVIGRSILKKGKGMKDQNTVHLQEK